MNGIGLRLSLELFFLKASQCVFSHCLQSTSLVPGSGLGTEGAGSLGTAVRLSSELTIKEGRLVTEQAAELPGGL